MFVLFLPLALGFRLTEDRLQADPIETPSTDTACTRSGGLCFVISMLRSSITGTRILSHCGELSILYSVGIA